jgi:NitT/TauT family transport system ATP-binding protein
MAFQVEFYEVYKEFAAVNSNRLVALADINLNIPQGEIFVIVGPSGCGKTTLLRMVAGFDFPTTGRILFRGNPISRPGPERCIVSQEATLLPWRTVLGNVEFGLEIAEIPMDRRRKIALEYINMVDLNDFAYSRPMQLSGGMRQRAAIATALANKPKILLLDEPFVSLDEPARKQMQNWLLRLLKTSLQTALFVTHSIEEAIFLAHRIVVLTRRPGKIKESIEVNLPHPRDRASREFKQLTGELSSLLED